MRRHLVCILPFGVFIIGLWGCHPRARATPPEPETQTLAPLEAAQEPSIRDKDFREVPEVAAVYFELDKSELRDDARETLKRNYDVLVQHPEWQVLVEGHCDERGTVTYNLGLGEVRAENIRKYYGSLGIPATRIGTISYGKEKPVCTEHNEECWSKNRRGVTKIWQKPKGQ